MEKKYLGNLKLLEKRKTAFLSSRNAPFKSYEDCDKWLNSLNEALDTIICNNHSALERYVFAKLLDRNIPIIYVTPFELSTFELKTYEEALNNERMLIVNISGLPHNNVAEKAIIRNEEIIRSADDIIVAYCRVGGEISKLVYGIEKVKCFADEREIYYEQNSDISYKMTSQMGTFHFHTSEENGKEFLAITQTQYEGEGEFNKQTINIADKDIPELIKSMSIYQKLRNIK